MAKGLPAVSVEQRQQGIDRRLRMRAALQLVSAPLDHVLLENLPAGLAAGIRLIGPKPCTDGIGGHGTQELAGIFGAPPGDEYGGDQLE